MTPSVIDAYVDALLDDSAPPDGAYAAADRAPATAASTGPGSGSGTTPPVREPAPEPMPQMLVPAPAAIAAPAAAPPARTATPPVRNSGVERDDADTATRSISTSSRWLRMGIGADRYAFELLRVQEVVRTVPILAMRGANVAVLGVMNLRGRIVPVFDLGHWLGTAGVTPDERTRIVVIERDDELIGVLVSSVEDVVTLGREHIEPPLANGHPGATVGIARTGHAPTVLLDADALFD